VSGEGFRIENGANVVMENCLNEGVSGRGLVEIFFALPLAVEDEANSAR
jgi:hypothetical protein